ncbi:MAG: hypothetical protein A3J97_13300 [Spirochaetes bacterium RIFOXYC1_FULL_54_7]|nr:MAG: hypothetical protein A3J97_13300 [Spirochaetes bacterium RIFOXYC1_FULL_54_7]
MTLLIFALVVILLMAFGFPIFMALFCGSLSYMLLNGINMVIAVKQMISGVNSFILLAVPLFILAAQVMNGTNITKRLFDFSDKLVGHIPGGLSHVNILSSVIFSGMSGSAIADTAGIGHMAAESMIKKGFGKPYSAALTIASATIGPIIPPSIPMVIYAALSGASLGKLFLGGIIPGLLMAALLMLYCFGVAVKRKHPRSVKPSFRELFLALRGAFLPLMTPVILLTGIYTGIFTPTEAAAVATLYALIIALLTERDIKLKDLIGIGHKVVVSTGTIMIIIAAAQLFSWIIAREQIPKILTEWVIGANLSRGQVLLVLNIILLIFGCLFDTNTILLVFVPLMIPLLGPLGIDLVHFGVILCVNLMIGLCTPPFGMALFLISGLVKVGIMDILKELWPMLIALLAVLMMITWLPGLVLWLPGYY